MKSNLNLFEGFSVDMAADFVGLRVGEINWIRNQGIVTPLRKGGAYLYTFSDLLILRLVRYLKLNHVPVKNIKKAKAYLKNWDSSKNLSNVMLYVSGKTGHIYSIGDQPQQNVFVDLTQHGQLVRGDILVVLQVGKDLEPVRKDIKDLDRKLFQRRASDKFVDADLVYKKYGLA